MTKAGHSEIGLDISLSRDQLSSDKGLENLLCLTSTPWRHSSFLRQCSRSGEQNEWTYYSCKGQMFCSQHPHGDWQLSVTVVLGALNAPWKNYQTWVPTCRTDFKFNPYLFSSSYIHVTIGPMDASC